MSQWSLGEFGAYRKARELFAYGVADMRWIEWDPLCFRLVSQQVGSADSICANIGEGHGRLSRAEHVRFLDFARGSARETRGRYLRMSPWFGEDVIRQRATLADETIGILTSTIERLRAEPSSLAPRPLAPPSLAPRPSPLRPSPLAPPPNLPLGAVAVATVPAAAVEYRRQSYEQQPQYLRSDR
jgi:four helix bundle protein